MFSTGKKPSKSSNSKSRTGSSSKSKPGSRSKNDGAEEWSDWEWDEQWRREWRSREIDGKLEYGYRYPREDTPRSSSTGGTTNLIPVDEALEDEETGDDGERHYVPTGSQPITSLTRDIAKTSLVALQGRNFGGDGGSMVNEEGFPITRNQTGMQSMGGYRRGPATSPVPGSTYTMSPANMMTNSCQNIAESYDTPNTNQTSMMTAQQTEPESMAVKHHIPQQPLFKDNTLYKDFEVRPAKDFKFGRIFKTLWTEPKGQGMPQRTGTNAKVYETKYGEEYYTSIRRFVIVTPHEGHCLCLPILTYQGQATKKKGVKAQDHAIIYTKYRKKKSEEPKEIPGEAKLQNKAIRMEPLTDRDQLDPLSRLNYTKIYTVEYNLKVSFIGRLHEKSINNFINSYNAKHKPLPEGEDVEFPDDYDNQRSSGKQHSGGQYGGKHHGEGQYDSRRYVQGQYYEEGHYGGGQYGEGHYSEGQYGEGRYSEGHYSEGQYGEGHYGEGQYGEGHSGEGQYGEEQYGEEQRGEEQYGEEQCGEGQNEEERDEGQDDDLQYDHMRNEEEHNEEEQNEGE